MISKTIKEIASMVDGTLILNEGSLDMIVNGVVMDSRKSVENSLYIPIVGERVYGHTFIKDVEAKGAANHNAPFSKDDAVRALGEIWGEGSKEAELWK